MNIALIKTDDMLKYRKSKITRINYEQPCWHLFAWVPGIWSEEVFYFFLRPNGMILCQVIIAVTLWGCCQKSSLICKKNQHGYFASNQNCDFIRWLCEQEKKKGIQNARFSWITQRQSSATTKTLYKLIPICKYVHFPLWILFFKIKNRL